jgi:hypothetical protein
MPLPKDKQAEVSDTLRHASGLEREAVERVEARAYDAAQVEARQRVDREFGVRGAARDSENPTVLLTQASMECAAKIMEVVSPESAYARTVERILDERDVADPETVRRLLGILRAVGSLDKPKPAEERSPGSEG